MEIREQIKKETDPIYEKISKVVPEIEWAFHAPFIHKINELKKQKNAVILAHNYQTKKFFMVLLTLRLTRLLLLSKQKKLMQILLFYVGFILWLKPQN